MRFDIEIKLPSGKIKRVPELNNREYLTIIKYVQNGDYSGLNRYFEKLILDSDLNIFDRFYLLIYYRMVFIDKDIVLDEDGRLINVSLVSVLDKLEANYKDLEKTFEIDGINIILDIPNISYIETVDDLLIATIKEVTFNGKTLVFYDLDKEDQSSILDNLPVSVLNTTNHYIDTISKDLLNISIVDENSSIGIKGYNIDLISNSGMQFVANLFSADLDQFYNTIYMFQNVITPGADTFFELSPIETKIIMNHHSKRIKEEEDQLKKQQQNQ